VAGDLGGAARADGLLDAVGELGQGVLVDGAALAGAADAAHDLVAAEGLGDAAALDDGEHGFLDGGEPPAAGGARAAPAGGLPLVDLAGVDDLALGVPAERTAHRRPLPVRPPPVG
jgi:hypothetical protein